MSEKNQFSEELAAFYEASHDYGDIGDESFYLNAATSTDGPVLEGACGTGRLYLELLRQGVDADGFDVSPEMLEILREKAATEDVTPTVWQADLRSIGASRTYSLALVPYNSFCNLREVDDQLAALKAFHDVLAPGGRLLFDVYVPRYDVIAEAVGEWQEIQEVEYKGTLLRGRSKATIANQVEQTYRAEQELLDTDGDVVARDEFVLSHLPPQQVDLLARQSAFKQWSVWGGFNREPLTDGDSVQVWELVK
ncbi:Methyltransferase domain-containing protein [Haladaptatus litoreus]|uniref:Methyltransferase domain-containing protein n=1 Tax=Haladaptatus litoreus TaxID=553468 RepID=A0A1N6YKA3_9EURY|nr:class I SAM-dependent methyltransferase [Haladaptatus litoreus]SIR14881.1 Methyltransferase domain-containing protein [Haladaptatus litoreus]